MNTEQECTRGMNIMIPEGLSDSLQVRSSALQLKVLPEGLSDSVAEGNT